MYFHQRLFDVYFNVSFSSLQRQKETTCYSPLFPPRPTPFAPNPHSIHSVLFKSHWDQGLSFNEVIPSGRKKKNIPSKSRESVTFLNLTELGGKSATLCMTVHRI